MIDPINTAGWIPSNFVYEAKGFNKELALKTPVRIAIVLYDYAPSHPDELALKKEDVINVFDTVEEPGWLRGTIQGKVGLFPENVRSNARPDL